jgi:hypothetical protein
MWFNPIMEWVLKSPLQGMLSRNTMIVHYIGRKSGKTYHLPVGYLRIYKTLVTVSFKRRTWWRNLRGGAEVKVMLNGKLVSAYAQVVEDDKGVADGLRDYICVSRQAARILGVKFGADGQPDPDSLLQAARERVIVRTSLV